MATYSSNTYLSEYGTEMTANATYIYNYFKSRGWTKNAICAMLGNMQRESTINPGLWQNLDAGNTSLGLGLVQWTPATKLINWCNDNNLSYTNITAQCQRIIYELNNNLQWIATSNYPETFKQFTKSTKSINYLTYAFLKNYERAGVEAANQRVQHANHWFSTLSGGGSSGGTVNPDYVPRLTSDGMAGNLHWYSNGNPFYAGGYGLPNCTCYAYGRFWEIGDPGNTGANNPTTLCRGDAREWYAYTQDGYERGQQPQLGAIICFNQSESGHVAIVEKINDDGSIVTSNSAWGGSYFYLQGDRLDNALTPANHYGGCQGFIYNPFAGGGVDPEEYNKKKHYNFVLFNRRKREQQWIKRNF